MTKYALITGGTKGIGKAVALSLAEAGYDLLLTYYGDTDEEVRAAETACKHFGGRVSLLEADIAAKQSIDNIFRFISIHSIQINTIVFNAGLTYRASFEEITLPDWERQFFANVHFPVFLLQKIVDRIKPGGCVVFTGSLMGIEPHATSLSYGVTKSTVHALTKNLVKFMAPYRIRVNAVAPGFVDTDWQKNKPEAIRRNIESKLAAGRFCTPGEIADVYKLLIENQYFNGKIIVCDGGYSYK
jgi:3-oxoacyl-[acyl-carrier protein] reductase